MLNFAGWLFFVVTGSLNQLFLFLSVALVYVEVKIRWMHFWSSYTSQQLYHVQHLHTMQAKKKKEDMWCWMTLFFPLFTSVYWILNMHDKYSLVICDSCSWVSACVWSIVFIPNMLTLNLGKHFYLPKQSSACYTKRLITVFWLLLCQSVHHCWRGLEQRKKPHLLILQHHYLNVHVKKTLHKESALRVDHQCARVTIGV